MGLIQFILSFWIKLNPLIYLIHRHFSLILDGYKIVKLNLGTMLLLTGMTGVHQKVWGK